MIDLVNKTILIRNHEEYENILEECRKQGYRWLGREDLDPIQFGIPCTFEIDGKNTIVVHNINPREYEFCEASDILGEKEMTAREFVEWMSKAGQCDGRDCKECVFSYKNTEGGFSYCGITGWAGNEDEVLEIAKTGRITIDKKAKEELSMKDSLYALVKDKSNDEILRCVKYLAEKMKEKE